MILGLGKMPRIKDLTMKVSSMLASENYHTKRDEFKERRFAGLIHVRFLVVLVAIIEIVVVLYQAFMTTWSSEYATVKGVMIGLFMVAFTLALAAVTANVASLLVPQLAVYVLFVISAFLLAILALYALLVGASVHIRIVIAPDSFPTPRLQSSLPAAIINVQAISGFLVGLLLIFFVAYVTLGIVFIWWLQVVIDCYRFLGRAKRSRSETSDALAASCDADSYAPPRTFQLAVFPNHVVQATDV